MSLMSMDLRALAAAIGRIMVVLVVQVVVMAAFARFVIFRMAGKSYDAGVISAGLAGRRHRKPPRSKHWQWMVPTRRKYAGRRLGCRLRVPRPRR
jgi:hypothetical protein